MDQTRRRFIAAAGGAVLGGLAGCTGSANESPAGDGAPQATDHTSASGDGTTDDPTGTDSEDDEDTSGGANPPTYTFRSEALVLEDGLFPGSSGSRYATVLRTEEETQRFVLGYVGEDAARYVRNTDFEAEDLVVVQRRASGGDEATARAPQVTRDGSTLVVQSAPDGESTEESSTGTADAAVDTTLRRVGRGDHATPTGVRLASAGETFAVPEPSGFVFSHVELAHQDPVVRSGLSATGEDDREAAVFLVRSERDADVLSLKDHEDAQEYLDRTDFEKHALVVLESRVPNPCYGLAVEEILETSRRLRTHAKTTQSGGACTQQVTVSTALARVPQERVPSDQRNVTAVYTDHEGTEKAAWMR